MSHAYPIPSTIKSLQFDVYFDLDVYLDLQDKYAYQDSKSRAKKLRNKAKKRQSQQINR